MFTVEVMWDLVHTVVLVFYSKHPRERQRFRSHVRAKAVVLRRTGDFGCKNACTPIGHRLRAKYGKSSPNPLAFNRIFLFEPHLDFKPNPMQEISSAASSLMRAASARRQRCCATIARSPGRSLTLSRLDSHAIFQLKASSPATASRSYCPTESHSSSHFWPCLNWAQPPRLSIRWSKRKSSRRPRRISDQNLASIKFQ